MKLVTAHGVDSIRIHLPSCLVWLGWLMKIYLIDISLNFIWLCAYYLYFYQISVFIWKLCTQLSLRWMWDLHVYRDIQYHSCFSFISLIKASNHRMIDVWIMKISNNNFEDSSLSRFSMKIFPITIDCRSLLL